MCKVLGTPDRHSRAGTFIYVPQQETGQGRYPGQPGQERAEVSSLYQPGAAAKIMCQEFRHINETRTVTRSKTKFRASWAAQYAVCYKYSMAFRLTTSAFHQFSCARN